MVDGLADVRRGHEEKVLMLIRITHQHKSPGQRQDAVRADISVHSLQYSETLYKVENKKSACYAHQYNYC